MVCQSYNMISSSLTTVEEASRNHQLDSKMSADDAKVALSLMTSRSSRLRMKKEYQPAFKRVALLARRSESSTYINTVRRSLPVINEEGDFVCVAESLTRIGSSAPKGMGSSMGLRRSRKAESYASGLSLLSEMLLGEQDQSGERDSLSSNVEEAKEGNTIGHIDVFKCTSMSQRSLTSETETWSFCIVDEEEA